MARVFASTGRTAVSAIASLGVTRCTASVKSMASFTRALRASSSDATTSGEAPSPSFWRSARIASMLASRAATAAESTGLPGAGVEAKAAMTCQRSELARFRVEASTGMESPCSAARSSGVRPATTCG